MTDIDPHTDAPEVARNLSVDPDPIKVNEYQHATLDQIAEDDPILWGGPAEPGSFPDYDELTPDLLTAPPAIQMPRTPVDAPLGTGLEDRPFHDVFTQYPGMWEEVGKPALMANYAQLRAQIAAAAVLDTRTIYQGSGVLYGFTAFSVATNVTPFCALTDSLDGQGPVLATINNNMILSGFNSVGNKGIEFKTGLTLVGLTGTQLLLIPIIKRRHVIRRAPNVHN